MCARVFLKSSSTRSAGRLSGTLFTVNDQGQVSSIDINQPPSVDGWTYLKTKLLGVVAPAAPWDYKNDYTNMTEGFKAGYEKGWADRNSNG